MKLNRNNLLSFTESLLFSDRSSIHIKVPNGQKTTTPTKKHTHRRVRNNPVSSNRSVEQPLKPEVFEEKIPEKPRTEPKHERRKPSNVGGRKIDPIVQEGVPVEQWIALVCLAMYAWFYLFGPLRAAKPSREIKISSSIKITNNRKKFGKKVAAQKKGKGNSKTKPTRQQSKVTHYNEPQVILNEAFTREVVDEHEDMDEAIVEDIIAEDKKKLLCQVKPNSMSGHKHQENDANSTGCPCSSFIVEEPKSTANQIQEISQDNTIVESDLERKSKARGPMSESLSSLDTTVESSVEVHKRDDSPDSVSTDGSNSSASLDHSIDAWAWHQEVEFKDKQEGSQWTIVSSKKRDTGLTKSFIDHKGDENQEEARNTMNSDAPKSTEEASVTDLAKDGRTETVSNENISPLSSSKKTGLNPAAPPFEIRMDIAPTSPQELDHFFALKLQLEEEQSAARAIAALVKPEALADWAEVSNKKKKQRNQKNIN